MSSADFTAVMNEFTYAKRLAANFSCYLHFNYLKHKIVQIRLFPELFVIQRFVLVKTGKRISTI